MDDVVTKPSSSEDLIASLINEVQQLKQPFDVSDLLPVRSKKTVSGSKSRTPSLSPKHDRKEKKHKEKKLKKSKRWKRTPSKSPPRKKNNKRKDRSRSASYGSLKDAEFVEVKPESKSFVEAALERISDDDEDDLPIGADFRTLSSIQNVNGAPNVSVSSECEKKPLSPDVNKRREFGSVLRSQNEEVFPLSKPKSKRDRSESPPIPKSSRPLSEILAKVKAEKNASFVPRNVKLKQEVTKSSSNIGQRNGSPTAKANQNQPDNEEYGPLQAPCPSGPLPISDDDDDEATFSGRNDLIQPKTIKFGSIGQIISKKIDEKQEYTKHSGEVPVSEDSTVGKDDLVCSDEAVITKKEGHQEPWKESRKMKHDKRRKKERKRRKRERRRQSDEASSSSDSEKEWEKLRKRQKLKYDPMSPRGGNFRYAVSSNDFKSFNRRGDGFDTGIGGRSSRDKRIPLPREKIWRTDSAKRRMDDKRRYHRRRSLSSSDRRRSRTYSKSRSRSRNHSSGSSRRSSRSRSRSNSSDYSSKGHKIDKKKLLEIAQKNAAQMAQLGYLPNAAPEIAARMKTGMQSVDQLVDFCQKLQRSQEKDEKAAAAAVAATNISSTGSGSKPGPGGSGKFSNDEEDLLPRKKKLEETTEFVKHPFAIKPAVPITINITNAASLPIKSASAQRVTEDNSLRLSYPVSSGQQHREKNSEWVPVTKGSETTKKNGSFVKGYDGKVSGTNGVFLLPPPPKPPVLLPHSNSAPSSLLTLPPPPPPPSILLNSTSTTSSSNTGTSESRSGGIGSEQQSRKPPENVGKVIAKRLEANRRLRENPNDFDALKMLKEAEEQVNAWAASSAQPGQYSGSTGVQILSADQLGPSDSRRSAWAKKDMFYSAAKLSSGIGLKLMQKMGWTPGEGLGKCCDGPLEPLSVEVKSDRKGLVATEDVINKRQNGGRPYPQGKHPVSLLMELCTKKKWKAPQFFCTETGPSNNRRFLWKAIVNGVEYQPQMPSNNKKNGKAQTCELVLRCLGLIPQKSSFMSPFSDSTSINVTSTTALTNSETIRTIPAIGSSHSAFMTCAITLGITENVPLTSTAESNNGANNISCNTASNYT